MEKMMTRRVIRKHTFTNITLIQGLLAEELSGIVQGVCLDGGASTVMLVKVT